MRSEFGWQLRSRTLLLGQRTQIMGIVNVTPDSFSDGGAHASTIAAVDHALRLLDEGADLLDVGGESTRPGAPAATPHAIAANDEQRRVLPVIQSVLRARPNAIVSVDTYRAATARLAIEAGAEIVNDVSGLLWDDAMAQTLSDLRCGAVLMHARGLPSEWTRLPSLEAEQVLPTVHSGLQARLGDALAAGIARERIALDPGFGFGKRGAENWALLAQLDHLNDLACPMLVGLSRKGFLASSLPAHERDPQTHAANTVAVLAGAHVLRVHDVAGAIRAAGVADAVLAAAS
ncbi:dihydropteroate synthase [Terriglobus sp.]|uniref:dihydropteroate synthase n=1 Tax=Terriglobus sp. TaxID=1889013 RepID=UPI003B00F0CD